MQQLQTLTKGPESPGRCATEILEAVPTIMRFIRAHMRRHGGADLSVPQFRTLVLLSRSQGASLSAVAEHLGLSLPATSRLIGGLVKRNYVVRRIPAGNRRLVALSLSARGRSTVLAARRATENKLAEVVSCLSAGERAAIRRALRTLREKFESAAGRDVAVKVRS